VTQAGQQQQAAAGAAPDWREMKISRVTGFPFHPPADKREGAIHAMADIPHASPSGEIKFLVVVNLMDVIGNIRKTG